MSLRRIAGVAVAAAVASGAGLLLSGPSGAATTPTPITLEATGLGSSFCPLPINGSIAVKPSTIIQFKQGVLGAATSEGLTIKPAPNSADPTSSTAITTVPAAGTTPITFSKAATYSLTWQFKATAPGVAVVAATQTGKLIIDGNAQHCVVAVQIPMPSVSASAAPSVVASGINGAIGAVVSGVNGALGPVNGALPTGLPPVPGPPGVPGGPGGPGGNSPGTTATNAPGTTYKPTGPTVADRTVPKGYGSGSGLGGSFVPVTGGSINASGQQPAGNAQPAGAAGSAAQPVKGGGSPRTVELASNRPRSAFGALPTLAVILAILALSGATAGYARTFLLQPAPAEAKR